MISNIGLHIIADDLTNTDIINLVSHIKHNQTRYINIKGGERFDRAMQLTETIKSVSPQTKVILRKWPDDGILKRYNYDTNRWFNDTIKPIESWLQAYKPIWLVDNESVEGDLTQYANASNDIMYKLGSIGLGAAVGRFATGNPAEHQYSQLHPMWQGLKVWFGLSIWSPNEYYDQPNTLSGGGSISRYKLGWNYCKKSLNFIPETVIGEFGLAVNYDPQKGFRKIGLDENAYFNQVLDYYTKWYAPYEVPICIFSFGNWHGFDVSKSFLDKVQNNDVNTKILEKAGVFDKPETPPTEPPIDEKPDEETGENNMNIGDIIRSILTKDVLVTIVTPLIAFLLTQIPDFPFSTEQVVGVVVAIILYVIARTVPYDVANVMKGNTWNKETKNWE